MKNHNIDPFLAFRTMALQSIIHNMQNDDEGDPTDKRPQRDEHKKDEAIEEYVEPDPNEAPDRNTKEEKDEKVGRSDKAKNQPTDERDRYMDK